MHSVLSRYHVSADTSALRLRVAARGVNLAHLRLQQTHAQTSSAPAATTVNKAELPPLLPLDGECDKINGFAVGPRSGLWPAALVSFWIREQSCHKLVAVHLQRTTTAADDFERAHTVGDFANWLVPGSLMLGRYPYCEPSRCTSHAKGETQLQKVLEAGITTFVSLQVGDSHGCRHTMVPVCISMWEGVEFVTGTMIPRLVAHKCSREASIDIS
jgi:hypothetical protein